MTYKIYVKRFNSIWKSIYVADTWADAKKARMHYVDAGYKTRIVKEKKK